MLRSAADRENADGVDSLAMPAREMLADLLFELMRPGEALTEYQAALKNSPNRFDALYGAGHAAQIAGDLCCRQRLFHQANGNFRANSRSRRTKRSQVVPGPRI